MNLKSVVGRMQRLVVLGTVLMAVWAGQFDMAGRAHASELGLTPSHVFATWKNINAALVAVGGAASGDPMMGRKLSTMEPTTFDGKKPGDVLAQIVIFRQKLDRLSSKQGLNHTAVYLDPAGGTVTPSVVFLNSGHVLDSTVNLLISLDSDHLISGFFERYDISGKTPDGPYSLVDLANRRIDALLSATNT